MKLFGCSSQQLRHMRIVRRSQWQPAGTRLPRRSYSTDAVTRMDRAATNTSSGGIVFGSEPLDVASTLKQIDMANASSDVIRVAAELRLPDIKYARPVPISPSYFSRATQFNDMFVDAQELLTKTRRLPTVVKSKAPRMPWMNIGDHRAFTGEQIKERDFGVALGIVKRLNRIDPQVRPKEVSVELGKWIKQINPWGNKPKPIRVDKFGRAIGTGKRKEAIARAWVVEGTGEVLINGKNLVEAFGRVHDRESAVWGLYATNRMDKYNVWALVEGGGTTGQAEALAMAVAKALVAHEPALKTALRKAGCITRDPREVERKKAGHLKSRKKPAWVKR